MPKSADSSSGCNPDEEDEELEEEEDGSISRWTVPCICCGR